MSDYINLLFSYVPPDRLDTFSFGHVIPPGNLTAQLVVKGVQGSEFDFTYDARASEKMVRVNTVACSCSNRRVTFGLTQYTEIYRNDQIIDLGRTIAALCQVIPDGVVAFFPSYDYLAYVVSIWKKPLANDSRCTVLTLLETKKPVLYESRETTPKTEDLLRDYSTAIDTGSGALLLSVVGGKLSEGINFSDKLGRGVLIIGLPFPNIRSAVWQAKIRYVEAKAYEQQTSAVSSEESTRAASKAAGRDFYENACMRAVNQCIGRAIRHRNDYAAIVMMDKRYTTARIQAKLPAWIKQSLVNGGPARPAGATVRDLAEFFNRRSDTEAI